LSLMLRRGIEVIVGAALAVVVLFAVVPAVAQAQEARSAKRDASATSVVVWPGDDVAYIADPVDALVLVTDEATLRSKPEVVAAVVYLAFQIGILAGHMQWDMEL
jgi:phosphohistidine swiveling domain-containing protein